MSLKSQIAINEVIDEEKKWEITKWIIATKMGMKTDAKAVA